MMLYFDRSPYDAETPRPLDTIGSDRIEMKWFGKVFHVNAPDHE
jgi:hypothetical protein